MAFVQIIEWKSSKIDEMRAVGDEWDKATEGKRTVTRRIIAENRDDPGRFMIFAFFDSYEAAMENSNLPETDALSKKMMSLADGPPTFYNLNVVEER
jgi:hypothetical protein